MSRPVVHIQLPENIGVPAHVDESYRGPISGLYQEAGHLNRDVETLHLEPGAILPISFVSPIRVNIGEYGTFDKPDLIDFYEFDNDSFEKRRVRDNSINKSDIQEHERVRDDTSHIKTFASMNYWEDMGRLNRVGVMSSGLTSDDRRLLSTSAFGLLNPRQKTYLSASTGQPTDLIVPVDRIY